MKKIELLAPAGDRDSFIAAVHCGADAIYIGGSAFNARAYAVNFSNDDIQWAVLYAHTYQVKVYVTVNTLYKDDEFSQLLQYIDFLYEIQVDALIIQDLGLFLVVKQTYPDFELHMSTQATIMNLQAVNYFEKIGASRIVLARENTLDEIKEIIAGTNIEIEVFVHGALCICYSGQCLMSSMIGKRSGNRGICAQPCRLKYHLMQDGKLLDDKYPYLLSPRDLMTIDHVDKLIEAGIHSLKIEGRMKKPEYVVSTVKAYRQAIDAYYAQQNISLKKEKYDMMAMFNRQYTSGYLFNDKHIVDGDYSGNKGIVVGEVVAYNKKKKRVKIRLFENIQQGDSLVFEVIDKGRPINKIYKEGRLVNCAFDKDVIEIEFDYFVNHGKVRRTVDTNVVKELHNFSLRAHYKKTVTMLFEAKINQPATLTIYLDNLTVMSQSSKNVESASQTPTDKKRIEKQLQKLGQTPFIVENLQIIMDDNISIPIKDINSLRREACEKLEYELAHQKIHFMKKQKIDNPIKIKNESQKTFIHVSSLDQLEVVKQYPNIEIIYPYQNDTLEALKLCPNMILSTSKILKTDEIENLKNSEIYTLVNRILVDNYGSYAAFKDKELIIGTGLNIYNSYSAQHFSNMKILSSEMSLNDLEKMNVDLSQCIIQVYGKIENMISEFCPVSFYHFGYSKKKCQICRNHTYSLVDRKNLILYWTIPAACIY